MKYQWLEELKTCEELGAELGCKVKSITRGQIIIGYEERYDKEGNPVQLPITKRGVEIELGGETSEILERLDMALAGLKRKGGKLLADEMDNLKARIGRLERR